MNMDEALRLLAKAERKLDVLLDQLGVLRCEGPRGSPGERFFPSLLSVLNELRAVRNRIKLAQFEIFCVEERRNPPKSIDIAGDIMAIAKELGILPESQPDLESPLDLIWNQIVAVHQQYVQLQFEGREAYGYSVAGNPMPARPIEVTEAAKLLTRMSLALGKAQLAIVQVRAGAREGQLPEWLDIRTY